MVYKYWNLQQPLYSFDDKSKKSFKDLLSGNGLSDLTKQPAF